MFFQLKDYNQLTVSGNQIKLRGRIRQVYDFKKYIVVLLSANKGDPEYNTLGKENIYCYDAEGNLKWVFPKGITGMEKIDEDTVSLYDGSWDNYVKVSTGEVIKSIWVK